LSCSFAGEIKIDTHISELQLIYGYDSVWYAIHSLSGQANNPSPDCSLLTSLNYGCNDGANNNYESPMIDHKNLSFELIEAWCRLFEYFRLSLKSHNIYEEDIFMGIYLSDFTDPFNYLITENPGNDIESRLEGGLTSYEEESVLRNTLNKLSSMSEEKRMKFISKYFSVLNNMIGN
jgi:hypothetical protein